MNKGRMREIKALATAAGAEVADCSVCGSGHYRGLLQAPDGRTQAFIFSNTPGDHRGDLNKRSMIRRWVRTNEVHGRAAA